MAYSWTEKIRNALEGAVDGSDVLARLVSTTQLSGFRAQLADRRLEIAWVAQPWRVPIVLAPFAAPLWLADWLVALAQSFADAEAGVHPERSTAMPALTRGQLLALLEPVAALQSELSGLLADPHRRSTLTLPLLLKPYVRATTGLQAERIPEAYVRGLLAGVRNVAGSVQMLAADYQVFFADSTGPARLHTASSTLQGELAAMESRLEGCELRLAALVHGQNTEETALRDLALELWAVTATVFTCGQQLAAPSLLPGVAPLLAAAMLSDPPQVPPARSVEIAARPVEAGSPRQPPAPEPPEPPRVLPDIAIRPDAMPVSHTAAPADPSPIDVPQSMPEIGGASKAASPHPASWSPPVGGQRPAEGLAPRAMPRIGTRPAPAKSPEVTARSDEAARAPSHTVPTMEPAGPGTLQSGRPVYRADRWLLSGKGARHRLRRAGLEDRAESELTAWWEARGWALEAGEVRYLDEIAAHLACGSVMPTGRSLATCPYAPIYRVAGGPIRVLDRVLEAGVRFAFEYEPAGRGLITGMPAEYGVRDDS